MLKFGAPVFLNPKAKAAGAGESHGASGVDPEELALAHKRKGYTAAYAPQLSPNDSAKIREFKKAFEKHRIMFAEVGFWDNLIDLQPKTREANRRQMLDALALADELGARCVVDIFGSYCHGNGNSKHAAKNFSKEAFDEAVSMARYFIDEIKPKRAFFAYEIFPFSVVDSPEEIAKLVKAVDRKRFGVHLDLVNLINAPRAYWRSGDIMRDCVKLFGDRIVSAHGKDIKMKEPAISVILEEVIAGTGALDIETFVKELHKLPQEIPLMLEHLKDEAEYDVAAACYRKAAEKNGIKI